MHKARLSGFTIVELLIVIVVIGVLASITVVTFNGVQKRAYVTTVNDAGVKIVKVLAAYHAANGSLPTVNTLSPCIGTLDSYPAEDNFAAGECARSSTPPYGGQNEIDATTMSQINSIAGSLKVPKMKPVLWVDSDAVYRGYFYSTAISGSTITARITWYFQGSNESCGAADYYAIDSGANTMCRASVDLLR